MSAENHKILRFLKSLRENVNIRIYDSKTRVEYVMRIFSVFASLLGVAALILFHGFKSSEYKYEMLHFAFRGILIFYYIQFFVGYVFTFSPISYFKDNIVQGILLILILCGLIYDATEPVFLNNIIKNAFSINNPRIFSTLIEQASFIVLFIMEIGKATAFLPSIKTSPAALFVLSFIVLIFAGTGLLMLPRMTTEYYSMSFIDALFTVTSACCVTGLSVINISTELSLRGQFLIMLLIQMGGLNIISFATFFLILSRKTIGIKNQTILKDSLDASNFRDGIALLKEIFLVTFTVELIGAVLIFFNWNLNTPFINVHHKIFASVFHSISAFNNAGFSLFTNGLAESHLKSSYNLQFVIAILIIIGGIGFPVIRDIFSKMFKKDKTASKNKWNLNTRFVVYTSLFLIFAGMLLFLALEWNNSLSDMDIKGKIMASFFQSVSSRTAGFNTIAFNNLLRPTYILLMFLMFVGASPISTGGGIKTSTFAVLCLSAYNTVKGKPKINIERTQVDNSAVLRSMTILLFSAGYVIISTAVISYFETDKRIMDLVFEQVSAFGTVGLSTGITPFLGIVGKVCIIITMFMGRIGLLTFGFALASYVRPTADITYPKSKIIIN